MESNRTPSGKWISRRTVAQQAQDRGNSVGDETIAPRSRPHPSRGIDTSDCFSSVANPQLRSRQGGAAEQVIGEGSRNSHNSSNDLRLSGGRTHHQDDDKVHVPGNTSVSVGGGAPRCTYATAIRDGERGPPPPRSAQIARQNSNTAKNSTLMLNSGVYVGAARTPLHTDPSHSQSGNGGASGSRWCQKAPSKRGLARKEQSLSANNAAVSSAGGNHGVPAATFSTTTYGSNPNCSSTSRTETGAAGTAIGRFSGNVAGSGVNSAPNRVDAPGRNKPLLSFTVNPQTSGAPAPVAGTPRSIAMPLRPSQAPPLVSPSVLPQYGVVSDTGATAVAPQLFGTSGYTSGSLPAAAAFSVQGKAQLTTPADTTPSVVGEGAHKNHFSTMLQETPMNDNNGTDGAAPGVIEGSAAAVAVGDDPVQQMQFMLPLLQDDDDEEEPSKTAPKGTETISGILDGWRQQSGTAPVLDFSTSFGCVQPVVQESHLDNLSKAFSTAARVEVTPGGNFQSLGDRQAANSLQQSLFTQLTGTTTPGDTEGSSAEGPSLGAKPPRFTSYSNVVQPPVTNGGIKASLHDLFSELTLTTGGAVLTEQPEKAAASLSKDHPGFDSAIWPQLPQGEAELPPVSLDEHNASSKAVGVLSPQGKRVGQASVKHGMEAANSQRMTMAAVIAKNSSPSNAWNERPCQDSIPPSGSYNSAALPNTLIAMDDSVTSTASVTRPTSTTVSAPDTPGITSMTGPPSTPATKSIQPHSSAGPCPSRLHRPTLEAPTVTRQALACVFRDTPPSQRLREKVLANRSEWMALSNSSGWPPQNEGEVETLLRDSGAIKLLRHLTIINFSRQHVKGVQDLFNMWAKNGIPAPDMGFGAYYYYVKEKSEKLLCMKHNGRGATPGHGYGKCDFESRRPKSTCRYEHVCLFCRSREHGWFEEGKCDGYQQLLAETERLGVTEEDVVVMLNAMEKSDKSAWQSR